MPNEQGEMTPEEQGGKQKKRTNEIGRWNGHKFLVSPKLVRGFTGLTIKGSSDTEVKTKDKHQFVSRKNGKPMEVGMTVTLHWQLGVDVRTEAIRLVEEAYQGKSDYFYLAQKKLVDCKLRLTDAAIKETQIEAGGAWVRADVDLTFKQAEKYYSAGTEGSGGKKKKKHKKKKVRGGGKKQPTTPSKFPDSGTQRHRSRGGGSSSLPKAVKDAGQSIKDLLKRAKEIAQGK